MHITFEGQDYSLESGETVLQVLERHGVAVASFCRSGACQTCIMKAAPGSVPALAQAGLKQAWKQQGLFLSCICKPTQDLAIERTDAARSFPSQVVGVEHFTERVLRVTLERPRGFVCEAGQFIQLRRPVDGLMRPYSVASLPSESTLELHVALLADGQMSQWLVTAQDRVVEVTGPFGECFYTGDDPNGPLLLAGTGTGLAPLLGVAQAALSANHQGPIRLYHGAPSTDGLYAWERLQQLQQRHPNLHVTGCVLSLAPGDAFAATGNVVQAELEQRIVEDVTDFAKQQVYLCGNPDLVRRLKKRVFLAGTPLQRILSDPFEFKAADSA